MNGSGVSSISPVLRKTNVTVMSNEQCATYYNIIYPGLICIDTRDGHGSCNVRHLLHLICFGLLMFKCLCRATAVVL